MANSNTIQLTLKVQDDGSVVIDQAAGKIEQFGKKNQTAAHTSASAWQKVKSAWLEIIGTIYAMQKAWDYMDMAAKAEQAEVAFRSITESVGVNANEMLEKMKKASAGTIDESHLMQKALKAIAQDVDPNKIPQIFDAARVGAVKAGEDISDVADQIIDAIANEMPRGLRKFGLVTKEQMSVFNKAVASGADNLNLLDLVIANAQLQEAKLALQTSSSAIAMQQFKAQTDEIKETLGGWLIRGLQILFGSFQGIASILSLTVSLVYKLLEGLTTLSAWGAKKIGLTGISKSLEGVAANYGDISSSLYQSGIDLASKGFANVTGESSDTSSKSKADWAQQQTDAQKQIDTWMAQAKAAGEAAKKAQELEQAVKKITEATNKAQEDIAGINQGAYAKEMLTIQNEVTEYQKAGVSKTKIDEYVTARKQAVVLAANKQVQDDTQSIEETIVEITQGAYAKEMLLLDDKVKNAREAGASDVEITRLTEAQKLAITVQNHKEMEDAIRESQLNIMEVEQGSKAAQMARLNYQIEELRKQHKSEEDIAAFSAARTKEINITSTKERLEAERDLYKDLRGYSGDYFEATKGLIDEQTRAYRALGISEIAIAAWVKEETENAYIEMAEKSDNWMAGVEAGLLKIKKGAMTTGKAMSEMVAEFANQASNTLSTALFDTWKGQAKSFKEYWNSLLDGMMKKLFDVFSQKFIDDILVKLEGLLGTKTSPTGQNKSSGGFTGWLGSILGGSGKGNPASAASAAASTITTTGNIYINTTGGVYGPGAGGVGLPGTTTGTGTTLEDTAGEETGGWLSSLTGKFTDFFSSFFNKIQGWFSTLSNWLSGLFSSMSNGLSSLLSSLGSMFGGGGGGMGFGSILSSIGGIFGFADGGWIPEPVFGRGMTSGRYYSFAENEAERVMTKKDLGSIYRGSGRELSPQRPVLNARIINVLDPSIVGNYLATDAGEQIIMNIVKRNQGALAH